MTCRCVKNFLKLDGFCILIIVLLIGYIICKMRKKYSDEKSKFKPIIDFIKAYCIYIITLIISLLILYLILYVNSNILQLISDDNMGEALGLIISAVITVTGVFVGFYFNKRQTYKEIVTRERIEWLHKMQEALAEFLSITSNSKVTNRSKDKKDRARELYYLIISNLNVKVDKEKKNEKEKENENENERDAVELLYKYANSKGLDVELNFYRKIKSEENKDANGSISHKELEKEIEKLKERIKALEYNITIMRKTEEADPLAELKRKEIISKYTEIFNETWNRIKKEAD